MGVMEIHTFGAQPKVGDQPAALTLASRPALLQWVTPQALEALREPLARGHLPPDFLGKLQWLAAGSLSHRFIAQQCRLFASLLLAAEHGSFREISRAESERLLRVLAYVRKNNDAIPDYQAGGFVDDQQEVRAASVELAELLQAFKVWRLRFQVPAMWHEHRVA